MSAELKMLLYPLADNARMGLKYKAKGRKVVGKKKITFKLANMVRLPITSEVVSSFINTSANQACVLMHLKGHLYTVLCNNGIKGTVSTWVVSSQALGVKRVDMVGIIDKAGTIREALDMLKPGVKASFYKSVSSISWKSVAIP